jgi:hypothetical protein
MSHRTIPSGEAAIAWLRAITLAGGEEKVHSTTEKRLAKIAPLSVFKQHYKQATKSVDPRRIADEEGSQSD